MIRNYLKIAFRNILKHKGYSFINITGLVVGLTCCLLILLWVADELNYDNFHKNKEDIYLVYSESKLSDGNVQIYTNSYYPLAKVLKEECSEIKNSVRFETASGLLTTYNEKKFTDDLFGLADPSFFNIFTFEFIHGDPKNALSDRYSIVLTEETAHKYFGDENPIGQVLNVQKELNLKVTGVIKNVPIQSTLKFDCIVTFTLIFAPDFKEPTHWGGNPLTTFIQLHKNLESADIEKKITETVDRHRPSETKTELFHLFPLAKLHLYQPGGGGLILSVIIFSVIALFVLMIACINFMNLTTARASTRMNEIGLRKVIGAKKADLIRQFLGESIIISFMTMIIAILMVIIILPIINDSLNKHISVNFLFNPEVVLIFIGAAFLLGIFSGSYPAFYLAALKPLNILKGFSGSRSGSLRFRKILVVGQYTLSIIMIIGLMVVYNQLGFIENKDLGFEKNNLIHMNIFDGVNKSYGAVIQELKKNPNIINVTRSLQNPVSIQSSVSAVDWEGKSPEEKISFNWDVIDYNYIETLNIPILQGRSFSEEYSSDSREAVIINEEASKLMGEGSPVGKRLSLFGESKTVIGVAKNFHYQSLFSGIQPFVFMMDPAWSLNQMFIRINPNNVSETLDYIKSVYKKFEPDYPASVYFFDDTVMRVNYSSVTIFIQIAGYFTILAIIISCLGLLGLAAFITEQRKNEIGIRKVLGSHVTGIVLLLSKDFLKWVLISNIFAWPIAWYIMNSWLQNFAYKIDISVVTFIVAASIVFLIAFLTVGFQALKAASLNPVNCLRYE